MGRDVRKLAMESLAVYYQVQELFRDGKVVPYDDYLIEFLATHTNKGKDFDNYLDSLNSTNSISKCYDYARYLALGMKDDFKLIEGNLSALSGGYFAHCWIETEEYVYDVAFSGKWPKKLYYEVFKPIEQNIIDLSMDKKYNSYLKNNIIAEKKAELLYLKYIGWYGYTQNMLSGWPMASPPFCYFPQEEKKAKEQERKKKKEKSIINKWYSALSTCHINYSNHPLSDWTYDSDDPDEIPDELLNESFYKEFDDNTLSELCIFISLNRKSYDRLKFDKYDTTLQRKACEGNYSDTLARYMEVIPYILDAVYTHKSISEGIERAMR